MMTLNVLLGLSAFLLGFWAVDHQKDSSLLSRLATWAATIGMAFWGLWLAFVGRELGWGILVSAFGCAIGLILFALSPSACRAPQKIRTRPQPQVQPRGIK